MLHHVVLAVGQDQPGIVAAVTGAVLAAGGNLLDTSMTRLSGHFAIAIAVEADCASSALADSIVSATSAYDLTVTVRGVDPAVNGATPHRDDPWVVSVFGADRAGIVARVTALLAGLAVNIVDLDTRRVGAESDPVYAMVLEVDLPDGCDAESLRADLLALAEELGVSASLHRADTAVL